MKTKTKKQTMIILLSLLIIISIYLIPQVIAPAVNQNISLAEKTASSIRSNQPLDKIDKPFLLIIISPQYQHDIHIQNTVINYQQAIYEQPGWASQIYNLTQETNTISQIDLIIEEYAKKYNISSILLIGEDIELAKKTEYKNIIKPDIKAYSTIKKDNISKQICVSLLQPHPADSYQEKQSDLIKTINRFSQKRILNLNSSSLIIEQKDISIYSDNDYKQLKNIYNASYQKDLSTNDFNTLFSQKFDLISLHGHGLPNQLLLNSTNNIKISSNVLSKISSNIVTIDGCYTDSIFKDSDNSQLVFLSSICKSNSIHIGFFGLLSQKTSTDEKNVINSVLSNIKGNQTIAETINNAQVGFDFVFSGDPTVQIIN